MASYFFVGGEIDLYCFSSLSFLISSLCACVAFDSISFLLRALYSARWLEGLYLKGSLAMAIGMRFSSPEGHKTSFELIFDPERAKKSN